MTKAEFADRLHILHNYKAYEENGVVMVYLSPNDDINKLKKIVKEEKFDSSWGCKIVSENIERF